MPAQTRCHRLDALLGRFGKGGSWMPELPDDIYSEARRWLGNVEDDLHAMRAVARDRESPARMACFLAHLVVETALKATLIDAGVPFKNTHDLVALHDSCVELGHLVGLDRKLLAWCNPWAVGGCYADDLADADVELTNRLAGLAEQVVADVQRELGAESGRQ